MKTYILPLSFLAVLPGLAAGPLALDGWTPNTPKTGTMTLEGDRLVLKSLDEKFGATVYHKRSSARPGQLFKLTVRADGQGTLETGLYLYGEKNGFLGRMPNPMKAEKIDDSQSRDAVYYLEVPAGVVNDKEKAAFYRPCLRVPKGEVRVSSVVLEETESIPKAVNRLDETRSVKGEILPFFTEPNRLDVNYASWTVTGGKKETADRSLNLFTSDEKEMLVAVSPPIKIKPGEKYLLTGLYHTSDAGFGSFGFLRVMPSSQVAAALNQLREPQLYSPFQGRELYNRKPGEWVRLTVPYTPPAGVNEVKVVITQHGTPCRVAWSSLYFGLGPWEKDSRNKEYDWDKYVNKLDPLAGMEDTLKILEKRASSTVEVKQSGYPRLFINGKLAPSLVYFGDFTRPERSKLQDFSRAGVNLQIIPLGRHQKIWRGNNDYDFAKLDELIWSNIRRNPEGNFIVLLDCSPYEKWAEEFPGETAVDSKGKPSVSRHGKEGLPSYWSQVYRRQTTDFIRAAVGHMKKQPYFKAVGGFFLSGNEDGQFYYQVVRGSVLEDGNSPGAFPEFRRWLKARYGTVEKLRQAWNTPSVTFENAVPPVTEKRYPGNFYDPATQMPQIDLTRFLNESMGEFANQMCRTAKEAAGKPVISVMWWGRGGSMMVYPHFAQTSTIFPSADLDLMGAQPGYQGERNAGCSNFFSWIPDSARIHGKVSMIEADFRTWTSPVNSLLHDYLVARFWNHEELQGALLRDFGRQLSVGGGLWFYDMTAGWFKDPLIMNDVAKMSGIGKKLYERNNVYMPAEIVFVVDEDNYYITTEQLGIWNGPNFHTVRKNQRAMLRSGLKYDFYYFRDLVDRNMDGYKVYVFLNAFHLTKEKREFIDRKLKKDGRTIVWVYAPGYVTDTGLSTEAMSKLTGIRIAEAGSPLKDSVYTDSPLGLGVAGKRVGMDNSLGGVSFRVEDAQAVPLMRYRYGKQEVSGAMRDFKSWKSIYLGTPVAFTPEFLGNLAGFAGIPVCNTPGDMFIYHRDDLICLHGVVGNENRIRLPFKATLRDLMTGEEIKQESGEFVIRLRPTKTRLLEIIR
ncbi:MAG: Beta-galactosidase [Lentisphaerae bacterium ADurb.Bin242]|nr:MAG: Beta-galactosidase [Lentisphaerae bacterium ADurb.Bin242]